jgi:predicted DNA binding CopG/RHH family protein
MKNPKQTLLGVRLPSHLVKQLKQHSVKSGIKIKAAVEAALKEYLKNAKGY